MKNVITFDVGGTNIRAARFCDYGQEPNAQLKTPTISDAYTPLQQMIRMVQQLWPESGNLDGIAVAAPGFIDASTGIVISAANVPGWEDLPLKEEMEKALKVPVVINNDARMAAFGEWRAGAGRGYSHMIFLTVSTGIGGGVIIDNRLLNGARGLATELGHLTLEPNGPVCSCGKRGHLEALASGQGIERFVIERLTNGAMSVLSLSNKISARIIADAAQHGDSLSREAFEMAGYYLGIGCAGLLHAFNPAALIIGGGVSFSGELLFNPFLKSLREQVMDAEYLSKVDIMPAKLGDNAGLIGAMLYLREQLQSPG